MLSIMEIGEWLQKKFKVEISVNVNKDGNELTQIK